jgi:hypothetical protein
LTGAAKGALRFTEHWYPVILVATIEVAVIGPTVGERSDDLDLCPVGKIEDLIEQFFYGAGVLMCAHG